MNISLEQLTQILAKAGISSSREEEILTSIKDLTTPLEANTELVFEESYTSNGVPLFKQDIEEDKEAIPTYLN